MEIVSYHPPPTDSQLEKLRWLYLKPLQFDSRYQSWLQDGQPDPTVSPEVGGLLHQLDKSRASYYENLFEVDAAEEHRALLQAVDLDVPLEELISSTRERFNGDERKARQYLASIFGNPFSENLIAFVDPANPINGTHLTIHIDTAYRQEHKCPLVTTLMRDLTYYFTAPIKKRYGFSTVKGFGGDVVEVLYDYRSDADALDMYIQVEVDARAGKQRIEVAIKELLQEYPSGSRMMPEFGESAQAKMPLQYHIYELHEQKLKSFEDISTELGVEEKTARRHHQAVWELVNPGMDYATRNLGGRSLLEKGAHLKLQKLLIGKKDEGKILKAYRKVIKEDEQQFERDLKAPRWDVDRKERDYGDGISGSFGANWIPVRDSETPTSCKRGRYDPFYDIPLSPCGNCQTILNCEELCVELFAWEDKYFKYEARKPRPVICNYPGCSNLKPLGHFGYHTHCQEHGHDFQPHGQYSRDDSFCNKDDTTRLVVASTDLPIYKSLEEGQGVGLSSWYLSKVCFENPGWRLKGALGIKRITQGFNSKEK
jgi:hypothetical protein